MARDGSGVYTKPFPDVVTNTTISSAVENGTINDIAQDLNTPRPIVAGGTGASTPDGALDSLSAEKFKQVVTNWDATTWRAGSYYAAATATGTAPVAGHAFAGTAYYANATDFVLHATDLTDPANPVAYTRVMAAGVWSPWTRTGNTGTSGSQIGEYLFDVGTTFPPSAGTVRFNNAAQNSTTELFFSHLTVTNVDITTSLPFVLRNGYDVAIADKVDITKYKVFTIIAAPVLSGGDIRVLARLRTAGADLTATRVVAGSNNAANFKNRNYVINGAMMISQENGATAGTGNPYYPADMFGYFFGGTSATVSVAQIVSGSTAGSPNRIRVTVVAGDVTQDAADYAIIQHAIEGYRSADLYVNGVRTVTLQFGVNAPAGTYCVALRNGAATRSYVAEYTIAASEASIDVVKSVTLQMDTPVAGNWDYTNNVGIYITWALICGLNRRTTPGIWTAGNFNASANQFNFMAFNGNKFDLFDVGLYDGNAAPPFMMPDYASELALCQRYYFKGGFEPFGRAITVNDAAGRVGFPVMMRATPTVAATFAASTGNAGTPAFPGAGSGQTGSTIYNGAGNWTVSAIVNLSPIVANARI